MNSPIPWAKSLICVIPAIAVPSVIRETMNFIRILLFRRGSDRRIQPDDERSAPRSTGGAINRHR
jgi:hypothetical protein